MLNMVGTELGGVEPEASVPEPADMAEPEPEPADMAEPDQEPDGVAEVIEAEADTEPNTHAPPTPSLLNVAAQPVAADVRMQPHYLGLSVSRSLVPSTRPRAADHRNFQSVLLRLAPPRLPPVGFGSISHIPHSLPTAAF
ncbi:hypothetical protein B0H10DRAFT_2216963 [Mycena sp. CBHHK59/15]|nr:hypothetical protein B0H10DRAFT_2216963 [Mycena sp. CBHHK59/15]